MDFGRPTPTSTGTGRIPKRREGIRPVPRPDRRSNRVRGAGHRCGRVPGAGAERGRLLPAARIFRNGCVKSATFTTCSWFPDEVICAFGRIGSMFACEDFGYTPDIITCAKGMSSGYSPIGAMIASDRLFEPFDDGRPRSPWLYTFGGHPVSAGVAGQSRHLRARRPQRPRQDNAHDLPIDLGSCYAPIVGDVRGEGFFYGIELVRTKDPRNVQRRRVRATAARILDQRALFEAGLYCPRRRPQ